MTGPEPESAGPLAPGDTVTREEVLVSIEGAVARPVELRPPELAALADAEVVADFHCHEGWSRLGERWRGVSLAALLSLAGASDDGRYVTIGSGGFTAVLSREQAEDDRVLLALERDGRPLRVADGLPRLVGPAEWDCFTSIKSVERIEVTREPAEATAERIALARLERGEGRRPPEASSDTR